MKNRPHKPYRVTCPACWQAGFRNPVKACTWCQTRKQNKQQQRTYNSRLQQTPDTTDFLEQDPRT